MSMSLEKHVTILSIVYIGVNVFFLLAAAAIFIFMVAGGLLSGEGEAILVTWGFAVVIAGFLAVLSIPGVIGGVGLVKRKGWARILVLVLGFLNLINFPLGTLLGVYTIWVLMQDEADAYFASCSSST